MNKNTGKAFLSTREYCFLHYLLVALLGFTLAACGGGSSTDVNSDISGTAASSPSNNPNQEFPVSSGAPSADPSESSSDSSNQGQSQDTYELSFVAGDIGGPGDLDGKGRAARFYGVNQLVADRVGNIFATDSVNGTIRKISTTGEVTTLAGSPRVLGSRDGVGSDAEFYEPAAIAIDAIGNLFVASGQFIDSRRTGYILIRKITPSGVVTTIAGNGTETEDGVAAINSRLKEVAGLAVDVTGNIYVSGDNAIRRIDSNGIIRTIAGQPGVKDHVDGQGADARLFGPSAIALAPTGDLYLLDTGAYIADRTYVDNATIRKITPAGMVSTLAGVPEKAQGYNSTGYVDGVGSTARFDRPSGIAIDNVGNLYIADTGNSAIRKITPEGEVTTIYRKVGTIQSGKGYTEMEFNPTGIMINAAGAIFLTDAVRHYIGRIDIDSSVLDVLAGAPETNASWMVDGTGSEASIYDAKSITSDANGNFYIRDRTEIRKITPSGVVSTFYSGNDVDVFHGKVGSDPFGNVFMVNVEGVVVRIAPDGKTTSIAGQRNTSGWADGQASAALFASPHVVVADNSGNLYVSDTGNHVIRKISATGIASTIAGAPGQPGNADGTRNNARFNRPTDMALSANGTLYVFDSGSNTVRKVAPSGMVSTIMKDVARGAQAPWAGYVYLGMAADNEGNLYLADKEATSPSNTYERARIRKITLSGDVITIADTQNHHGIRLGSVAPNFYPTDAITLVAPHTIAFICESSILRIKSDLIGNP